MPTELAGYVGFTHDLERLKLVHRSTDAFVAFDRRATELRDAIRKREPFERGELARATVSFATKRTTVSAIVRVNIFEGVPRAHHGLFVAFGTRERLPKTHTVLTFQNPEGQQVFARSTAPVRPNPFFERGVEDAGFRVVVELSEDLKRLYLK